MKRLITGLAATAAIFALSTTAMAQGQGGAGNGGSGQATWPGNTSPDPKQQPTGPSGAAEATGATPQQGTPGTDQTPSNSNAGPGAAMQPAPTPGNTPSSEAATGPKQ